MDEVFRRVDVGTFLFRDQHLDGCRATMRRVRTTPPSGVLPRVALMNRQARGGGECQGPPRGRAVQQSTGFVTRTTELILAWNAAAKSSASGGGPNRLPGARLVEEEIDAHRQKEQGINRRSLGRHPALEGGLRLHRRPSALKKHRMCLAGEPSPQCPGFQPGTDPASSIHLRISGVCASSRVFTFT